MEDAHNKDVVEVASYFRVDLSKGLNDYDVSAARAKYGRNELPAEEGACVQSVYLKYIYVVLYLMAVSLRL